jgi:hypothetical protein
MRRYKDLLPVTFICVFLAVGATGLVLGIVQKKDALDILEKLGSYTAGCIAFLAFIKVDDFINRIKSKKTMDIIFDNFHVFVSIVKEAEKIKEQCNSNADITSLYNDNHDAVKNYHIESSSFEKHTELIETISIITDRKEISIIYTELLDLLRYINIEYGMFVQRSGDKESEQRIKYMHNAENLSIIAAEKATQLLNIARSFFV